MASETQKLRGRPVTAEEAMDAAQRFINEHFKNTGKPRVDTRIPAQATDHDIVLTDYLLEVQETLALQRKQLRNAWAKLECRCIFNEQDEKTHEDAHCPYHGWYQLDPDNWNPIGDLRKELAAVKRERDEAWLKANLANEEAAAYRICVEEAGTNGYHLRDWIRSTKGLLLEAFDNQHFNDEMGDCFGCNVNSLRNHRVGPATKKHPAYVALDDEIHEEDCMWVRMATFLDNLPSASKEKK